MEQVLAFGVFDGIHIGHQKILNEKPNILYIFNRKKNLIYPLKKRIDLIKLKKIKIIEINDELLNTTADAWVNEQKKLGITKVILGYNAYFGKNKYGNYKNFEKQGIKVKIIPEVMINDTTVSSTNIKNYLKNGEIEKVNRMLGRKYSLSGVVVHGKGRGRKIGFPTANLKIANNLQLPKNGVYSGVLLADNKKYKLGISIGPNITYSETILKIEGNVPNRYDLDLYDKEVEFIFEKRIRELKKFNSQNELIQQIKRDKKLILSAV